MVGAKNRIAAAAVICVALAGCTSAPDYYDRYSSGAPDGSYTPPPIRNGGLQCVPYARDHSGVKIQGDAYTWWAKAEGRYAKGTLPVEGSVMVLTNYAGPNRGHVAVVRDIVNSREIRIDHANWLDDGAIYTDDPVMDVSQNNDWSLVRVFNQRSRAWGSRLYPVQGFIGPGRDNGYSPDRGTLTVADRGTRGTANQRMQGFDDHGTLTAADIALRAPEPSLTSSPRKGDAIAALLANEDDTAAN